MFGVGTAAENADLHIRDLRADKDSAVAFLLQMGHDQALPVQCQVVHTAAALKDQAAPRLSGLQQKVDLRIVPQRLKVTHSLRGLSDRLPIDNPGLPEFHTHVKPLPDQALQDFSLNLPHDLDSDFLFFLIIRQPQHGILFLQDPQPAVSPVQVLIRRQEQTALHDRLKQTLGPLLSCQSAKSHACPGP